MKRFAASFLTICLASQAALAETGITDSEILLGAHTAESGAMAVYAPYSRAWSAYIERVNAKGGVNGRKIKIIRVDTQGENIKTFQAVKKFVEQDQVFASVFGQGNSHQTVVKYLETKGVPDLLPSDALLEYGKVKTLIDSTFSYYSEGRSYGDLMVNRYKGKKACFLITDNVQGEQYMQGVKDAVEDGNKKLSDKDKVQLGSVERADRTASQANGQVLKLKKDNCDLVLNTTYGGLCPSSISYGASQGFKPVWFVMTWNVSLKLIELLPDAVKDGIISAVGIAVDDSFKTPGWADYKSLMETNNIPVTRSASNGYAAAEMLVEILKRAGKDINRQNVIKAAESIKDWKCNLCLTPLNMSPANHFAFERPVIIVSEKGKWKSL